MRWDSLGAAVQFPVLPPAPDGDTHELSFGTVVRGQDGVSWLYAFTRTTKTAWRAMLETGVGDRSRVGIAVTPDLMANPYPVVFWDLVYPWSVFAEDRPECRFRSVCGPDESTIGPFMPALVYVGDTLQLWVHDPSGTAVYRVDECGTQPQRCGYSTLFLIPDFAWSDIAAADDGSLRALVFSHDGSRGEEECFYLCPTVDEWVSWDEGRTWERGERSWSAANGLLVADAGYVRDESGGIRLDSTAVVALASDSLDPRTYRWRLYWWADPKAKLPASWGREPGWEVERVRRHLTRSER
jgi:hypothetical protein